ncbi:MAG: kinase/pyrophosphorylase [Rhodospirillales bacterium]|nr:kinase/pyrophosphorylase [Rhodospirillales bacterium]
MSDADPAATQPSPTPEGNGKTIVIHMVSHASGELVEMTARNAAAQLDGVTVDRHLWKFVRSLGLVPGILAEIAKCRGIVFHSIAATDIREALEEGCQHLRVPCLFVLSPSSRSWLNSPVHRSASEPRRATSSTRTIISWSRR